MRSSGCDWAFVAVCLLSQHGCQAREGSAALRERAPAAAPSGGPSVPSAGYGELSTVPVESVVIPAHAAGDTFGPLISLRLGVSDPGYWDVTRAEAQAFITGLPGFLRGAGDPRARVLADRLAPGDGPSPYRAQFLGAIIHENRVIYGNFFCASDLNYSEWKSRPIQAKDGGDCYFQVIYDVARAQFTALVIQGEA